MDIAFCTDNNYIMPCGITIISLLENNKKEKITIHLLGLEVTQPNKDLLKGICDKYGSTIHFYDVDKKSLNKVEPPIKGASHINISTFIRLFLPDILPVNVEKVLYLDCDLLILDDLSELWDTNIDSYSLAGVIDFPTFMPETYQKLKYPDNFSYVNAGVLLINLKYWRENDVLNKLLNYTTNNFDNIDRKDQDIINGALYDSIRLLPIRYNMHNFFFWRNCNAHQYQGQVKEALTKPAIIHFTTSMKPWLKVSVHPMTEIYREYKSLSPWKDVPITWGNLTMKRKIRYYKRVILDSLGLKKHKFIKM